MTWKYDFFIAFTKELSEKIRLVTNFPHFVKSGFSSLVNFESVILDLAIVRVKEYKFFQLLAMQNNSVDGIIGT